MARDPVCGMAVEPSAAVPSAQFEGQTFYFCCAHCQRTFEANPAKYASQGAAPASHGCCGGKAHC